MKNSITQFSLVIISVVALTFLLSYARPTADEPKQYMVVAQGIKQDKFEAEVNQKLTEGWRLQGGVNVVSGIYYQAMTK
jgi:hypothetical protein